MSEEFEGKKISTEKKWSLLCYLPVFNVVTCILAAVKCPNFKSVRFHYRQGLVLFVLWFLTLLVGFVSARLSLMILGIDLLFYFSALFFVYNDLEIKIPLVAFIAELIPEFYIFSLLTGKEPDAEWLLNNSQQEIK